MDYLSLKLYSTSKQTNTERCNTKRLQPVIRNSLLILITGLWITPTAYGLTADEAAAARQARDLQKSAQEQTQRQYEMDRKSARQSLQLEAETPTPKPIITTEKCWDITQIQFQGVTLINNKELNSISETFNGTCIGISTIESILGQITTIYINNGYITARAYLPEQDLSRGTLIIEVLEGQIESYLIQGDESSISLGNVAPGKTNTPFNLRDLEQTLDQINRLSSNNASFEIMPGKKAGGSQIIISNEPSKLWRLGITTDNHGSDSTGKEQLGLTYSYDNPLGFNDFISFTHRRAIDYHTQAQLSYSNSLTYVIPYGYSTFNIGYSGSAYTSQFVAPSSSILTTDGNSDQVNLRWDYLAYRNQNQRLKFNSNLTAKVSRNYLEHILLEVSSRRLTILDLGVSFEEFSNNSNYSIQLGHSRGLPYVGALEDPDNIPDWAPRAQFSKWTLAANWNNRFEIADRAFSWSSNVSGQYADDVLYGSEQLSIGSMYTVRGFDNNSLFGDHGIYLRNDINTIIPLNKGYLRPYIAVDAGWVDSWNDDVPDGSLSGMAFGISGAIGSLSFDLFHSFPLHQAQHLSDEDGGVTLLQMNLAI